MKILLSLLFCSFFIGIFGSPVQKTKNLGEPVSTKCYSGTYWCASLESAKNCNALKHCIHAVWEKQHLPEDNDSICKICLDMVTQARDQLESNQTQADLKAVFEGSCDLIPIKPVAKECRRLADDFIPELVEALASQMNPQVVCSTAGLCNNAKIDKMLEEYEAQQKQKKTGMTCKDCGTIGSLIMTRFRSSDRDQVLQGFLGFCGKMGSFSDACSSIVLTYFNDIYSELRSSLTSENICHLSGTCAARFHRHEGDEEEEDVVEIKPMSSVGYLKQEAKDDIPCKLCQQLVTHLKELLVANTTEDEFKLVLEGLCKQFGSFKDECISIVDQYYDVIYKTLVDDLDANGACFMIGICPKGDFEDFTVPVKPLVPSHIKSPKLGENEPFFTEEEKKMFQLPLERVIVGSRIDGIMGPKNPEELVESGTWCTICEYLLHFVQEELSLPKTEDEIKQIVSKSCDKMSKSLQSTCHSFVDLYGDAVMALLVQGIDPTTVCPALKMCPSVSKDVDIFAPSTIEVSVNEHKEEDKPKCPFCVLVITEVVNNLDSKTTKEEIVNVLDKVCNKLNSKFTLECQDFVETYTDELLDKLLKNFTPKEICAELRLCDKIAESNEDDDSFEFSFISGGDIETNEIPDDTVGGIKISQINMVNSFTPQCEICHEVVKILIKKIDKKTDKDEIMRIMRKECQRMYKLENKCMHLVEKDGDKFISLVKKVLENEMTVKELCRAMGACFISEAQDKLPKLDGFIFECPVCQEIVQQMEKKINDASTQAKIVQIIKKECFRIFKPEFEAKCDSFIDQNIDNIMNMVRKLMAHDLSPEEVCKQLGACTSVKNLNSDSFEFSDNALECKICEGTVNIAKVALVLVPNIKDEMVYMIKEFCTNTLSKKNAKQCHDFIDQNINEIFINILNMNPRSVCQNMGTCLNSSIFVGMDKCGICETALMGIKMQIDAAKPMIVKYAKLACSKIFTNDTMCHDFVDQHIDEVINYIKKIDNHAFCFNFGMCPSVQLQSLDIDEAIIVNVVAVPAFPQKQSQQIVRVPLQKAESKIHMIVTFNEESDEDKEEVPQKSKETVGDSPQCVMCEFVMTKLEAELKDKKTEDEIKQAVHNICTKMPKSISKSCNNFVDKYADLIIQLLETVSPKEVCQQMSLCPAQKRQVHLLGDSECTWGPSHFCSSEDIAAKCGATQYCKDRKIGNWSN